MRAPRDADGPVDAGPFLALLEQRAPRPLAIQEMARLLALEHYDRRWLKAALDAQVAKRALRRIGKTRYQWIRAFERQAAVPRAGERPAAHAPARASHRPAHAARTPRVEGHYARVRAGYGFVEVLGEAADRFPRDILIPAGMEGPALHGDRVAVEIVRRDRRAQRFVGRVVAVTGGVHEHVLGTLQRHRGGWHVVPENELLPPVEILGGAALDAEQAGLVARVRLTRRPTARTGPAGELESVLGPADDSQVQFLTIADEHGLRIEFPPAARAEAARFPADPAEADCAGREDLRHLPFVTIDGETARDFDDAVCLEAAADGGSRLWVAIAAVAHYVRPETALDVEAARRGASVYFPDRAIPMLPPQLSTGLCSLNPGRDRLVLVAELRYDTAGQRRAARFYRGVIRSRARLTYTQVAAVLSQADTPQIHAWRTALLDLLPQLRRMHTLMNQLCRRRVAAGSLDLDLPEALVDLSEEGRSIGVRLLQRNDAHRIIEELMLEANQAVALFLGEQGVPCPYRIHEPPAGESIDELNDFLAAFGFHVAYEGRVRPQDVQRLLTQLQGHRLERVLSRQVLRALTQAQYSTHNAGHFGLAFPTYCHFTSPIRRYPDLLVHRQLTRVLDGRLDAARAAAELMEAMSVQSSQAEREAMEAERAMLDLKKCEFMLGHLLEPEPGTIVSTTAFGVFVELDVYPIEGLVRIDDLPGDRFTYVEAERALKGWRTGQRLRIGDRVRVEATNVSLRRRQIDFALLERLAPGGEGGAPPARPRGRQRTAPSGRPRRAAGKATRGGRKARKRA